MVSELEARISRVESRMSKADRYYRVWVTRRRSQHKERMNRLRKMIREYKRQIREQRAKELFAQGMSANNIYKEIGGSRRRVLQGILNLKELSGAKS